MTVILHKGKCLEELPSLVYSFNYELDEFQKYSILCINRNENILVTAHTGSGKTAVAIYAAAHYMKQNKKVIYCSPIKTLSNQKYNEFKSIFDSVGIMTGDNKINPDANCVIMTTEILRNSLFKSNEYQVNELPINNIGCVIFDEIHYINDPDRGKVWEETLNLLDSNTKLVMLSATIENSYEFAEWISKLNGHPINLISTEKRIIPLNHYLYMENTLTHILDNDNTFFDSNYDQAIKKYDTLVKTNKLQKKYMINNLVEYLKKNEMFQTIFFCFSRKNCEAYAHLISVDLVDGAEKADIEYIFDKHMKKYENTYIALEQYADIKRLMMKGICYHHSGIIPIFKEIIEIIFQKGLVKILFATETFAVGVNMPTKTVVFTELKKYTKDGQRNLYTSEYKQMSGRAGRRGLDQFGTIIILPLYNLHDKGETKQIMTGKLPFIESQFYLEYNFILKILQSSYTIESFLEKTLFNANNIKKISYYNSDLLKLNNVYYEDSGYENIFDELIKIENYEYSMKNIAIKCKPNKKQVLEKKKLLTKIKDFNLANKLQEYKTYLVNKENLDEINDEIYYIKNMASIESAKLIDFLENFGYIINNKITTKGVMASQINDCNSILLTEIIINKIFDDLSEVEIVGVIALFIDDNIFGEDHFEYISNKKVSCCILYMQSMIDTFVQYQNDKKIYIKVQDYWKINNNFVNIAMNWANNKSLSETINGQMYVGNFVKNILKINTIIKDLVYLHTLSGNQCVIPKLEKIERLLIRDIVTINSLYL